MMRMGSQRKLIIDWGDLAGLTAIAIDSRPENAVLWHPVVEDEAGPRRRQAALEHASVFDVEEFIEAPLAGVLAPRHAAVEPGDVVARMEDAVLLTLAARTALGAGCGSVLWPAQVQREFDAAALACEQATLVRRLADAVDPAEPLRIETPFIELSDMQLIDLAARAGAPLRAAWWCRRAEDEPCGGCPTCLRWFSAAEQAALTLPWLAPASS